MPHSAEPFNALQRWRAMQTPEDEMDFSWLIPFLSLFTLLAVSLFAAISKERVDERRHDPNAPKSTLAKDGPQGGVAFLLPLAEQPRFQPHVRPVLE